MLESEPGIDRLNRPQGTEQKAAHHEQDDRRGDLGDNQSAAHPLSATTAAARALAQSLTRAIAMVLEQRHNAERDTGHHRQGHREPDDAHVHGWGVGDRQRGGHEAREDRQGRCGQRQTEHTAGPGDHQALGQQLPQHSFAASAERHADGHLPPPDDRAGEQEVGQVRARDQQHAHRRAEQRDEQRHGSVATRRRAGGSR